MTPSAKQSREDPIDASLPLVNLHCNPGIGQKQSDTIIRQEVMAQLAKEEYPTPGFPDKHYPFVADGVSTMRDFAMADDNLHLAVPPRKSYDHVKDKELRKKLKNRESAQAARDRKKAKMMFLERQVSDLIERNRYVEAENIELRKRIQMLETNSFWRSKEQHPEYPPSVNHQQFASSPEPHPEMSYSPGQDQIMGQPIHQTSCAFGPYSNGASINSPPIPFAKGQQSSSTDINGNIMIPRGMPKCDVFTEDKAYNHQLQQYMMHDGGAEAMLHSEPPRYPDLCFPQIPKLECNAGNFPTEHNSRSNSTSSSRKSSSSAGDQAMNAEDWLMLSFKSEVPTNIAAKASDQNKMQVKRTPNQDPHSFINNQQTDHEYSWDDVQINLLSEGHCSQDKSSKDADIGQRFAVPKMNAYNYPDNSYCDSSGMESMSSPDMSIVSTVSSPDGSRGLRQDFPTEKRAFKVH